MSTSIPAAARGVPTLGSIFRARAAAPLALAAALAAWAGPPAFAAPAAPDAPSGLSLAGAQLGMTLSAWRTLPFTGATKRPSPACAARSGLVQASARRGAAAAPPETVCSYVTRYGRVVLPQSFPLTAAYLARSPQYDFVDGRLARIDFRVSIDSFSDLVGMFTKRYGPAVRTVRDYAPNSGRLKLPRVRMTWRAPDGQVRLTDPSARPDQLEVEYLAPGLAAPRPS